MRITAGLYRGRTVACPRGEIRPAMDRMRESIFSILGDLNGASFLDLFSGSGIIGLEAASRGATRVVFVEKDPVKRKTLVDNISFAECTKKVVILPVERYVMNTAGKESFDYIFLDPPFPYKFKQDLLERVAKAGILAENGRILIHFPVEDRLPETLPGLRRVDRREFGRSIVSFYKADATQKGEKTATEDNVTDITD